MHINKTATIFLSIVFSSNECDSLKGRWNIHNPVKWSLDGYPIIEFLDNRQLILHSYGNTLYSGNYSLLKDKLIFNIRDQQMEINILKCHTDTLVLSGFKNLKESFIYLRKH